MQQTQIPTPPVDPSPNASWAGAPVALDSPAGRAALAGWGDDFAALEMALMGAAGKRRVAAALFQAIITRADPLTPLKERCLEGRNKALLETVAQLKSEGVPEAVIAQAIRDISEGIQPRDAWWREEEGRLQARLHRLIQHPVALTLGNGLLNEILTQGRFVEEEGPHQNVGVVWDRLAETAWRYSAPLVVFETTCAEWGVPVTCPSAEAVRLDVSEFLQKEGTIDRAALQNALAQAIHPGRVLAIAGLDTALERLGTAGHGKSAEAWVAALTAYISAQVVLLDMDAAETVGATPGLFETQRPYFKARRDLLKGGASLSHLETLPVPVSQEACPDPALWAAALEAFELILVRGAKTGLRAPAAAVIAPLEYSKPEDILALYAAAEPFATGVSEAIVTLAPEAGPQDIQKWVMMAWTMGLKGCRVQRRHSLAAFEAGLRAILDPAPLVKTQPAAPNVLVERVVERVVRGAPRRPLPPRRKGYTQKAVVGGQKIYLRTGEYENGDLGEIFVSMHKEGAAFRGLMNCFAMAVSVGLQYGVPLEEFVDAFIFTRFEPAGDVKGNDAIKTATSIIDYLFRELGVSYLGRKDLAHVDLKESLPDLLVKRGEEIYGGKTPVESTTSTGYVRSNLYILKRDGKNEPSTPPRNANTGDEPLLGDELE